MGIVTECGIASMKQVLNSRGVEDPAINAL